MDWLARGGGVIVVLLVLRDIFHTLGHPEGQGSMSRFVMEAIWRFSQLRDGKSRLAQLTGPLALFSVILVWALLAVVGWAFIYLPSVPMGFTYSSPVSASPALDSLYISLVAISTLGFGDIVPTPGWLRIVIPLEALFGFALLTVAVSWILQVYPALGRRRVLAIRLSSFQRAALHTRLSDGETLLIPQMLESLSTEIIRARVDLSEYSETYYFRDTDPDTSLAAMLPYAVSLALTGSRSNQLDMRLAATLLTCALDDFTDLLKDRFPKTPATTLNLLDAYAADHGHRPRSEEVATQ
jgi:hypothetical protein